MLSITKSIALQGLEGYLISIQVDISLGMPYFEIVRITRHKCKRIKRKSKNSNKKFRSRILKQKNSSKLSPSKYQKRRFKLRLSNSGRNISSKRIYKQIQIRRTIKRNNTNRRTITKRKYWKSKWNTTNMYRSKKTRNKKNNPTKRKRKRSLIHIRTRNNTSRKSIRSNAIFKQRKRNKKRRKKKHIKRKKSKLFNGLLRSQRTRKCKKSTRNISIRRT